ncbi:type IV pilin [Natrialba swarupiae]|uniref:Type IV pilin n=1 Tax=Natrialba swarupiae TaxID=2448032 RepID=A0A5D5ALN2_9EURY|nr:type IV pilin [Natrialba swarupiae]TYT62024.1 type IV pilin [Natrialba swarupiae]
MFSGGKKRHATGDERAVSPVIAVVLMIAITVAVVTVTATVLMGLTETPEPAPDTGLEVKESADGDGYELSNYAGDELDPDQVRLVGNETEEGWSEDALRSGERVELEPTNPDGEIRVVWESEDGETQHLLATLTVDEGSGGGGGNGGSPPPSGPPENPPVTGNCSTILNDTEMIDGKEVIVVEEVIECDINEPHYVHVVRGGGVIGNIGNNNTVNGLMIDDGFVNGSVNTYGNVNVTDGYITEAATGQREAHLEDADLYDDLTVDNEVESINSDVEGEITAGYRVAIESGDVEGGISSEYDVVVLTDATVEDDITTNDWVEIIDSDVVGSVNASGGDATLRNANVTGDLDAQSGVDIADSEVGGDVNPDTGDATLHNATVGGSLDAENGVEATESQISGDVSTLDGGSAGPATLEDVVVDGYVEAEEITIRDSQVGDVHAIQNLDTTIEGTTVDGTVSVNQDVDIHDGTVVEEDVEIAEDYGELDLDDGTVDGDAYVEPGNIRCNGDSEINGTDCEDYDPPAE